MIFPEYDDTETPSAAELPLYRDWAFDFENGQFALLGGRNYLTEGLSALRFWIWKALQTARGRFLAYSDQYGQDFAGAIGMTNGAAASELICEYIREALTASAYITDVTDFEHTRSGSRLTVSFTAHTVYGETAESVEVETEGEY